MPFNLSSLSSGNGGGATIPDIQALLYGYDGVFSIDYVTESAQNVTYVDDGNSVMDHSTYNFFKLTTTGTITNLTHSNVPAAGTRYTFLLELNWTQGNVTFPASWRSGDKAPNQRGRYYITGTTTDGGATWVIKVVQTGELLVDDYFAEVEVWDGQPLETPLKVIVEDFVNELVNNNMWDKISSCAVFGLARTLEGALVPLRGPALSNTGFVQADYTRNLGLKGDGATKWIDTNWPNINDPQSSQTLAVLVSDVYSQNDYIAGAGTTADTGTRNLLYNFAEQAVGNIGNNSTQTLSTDITRLEGRQLFLGVARETQNGGAIRLNNVHTHIDLDAQTPDGRNIYVFGSNGSTAYSDSRIFFYCIGEYLNLDKLEPIVTEFNRKVREFFGEALFDKPGTYSWTAPAGVTSVSAVCVGGGGSSNGLLGTWGTGGAGGGLGWKNNIPVVPGESYTVVVGAGGATGSVAGDNSYFIDPSTVAGLGGAPGRLSNNTTPLGGTYVGDGGGNGGNGGIVVTIANDNRGGGGGAGGYTGNGGDGGNANPPSSGANGTGGGGGGGSSAYAFNTYQASGAGGGVGVYGQGADGLGGFINTTNSDGQGGGGGSGGADASNHFSTTNGGRVYSAGYFPSAGQYGGGGACSDSSGCSDGAGGAVRIVWGAGRAFPATDVGPCPAALA